MNINVVTSREALVQVIATNLLTAGYRYYVMGRIPEGKDPRSVDAKLKAKYDLGLSRWQRARRKRNGHANVRYLRHGRLFVMLATEGRHRWFEDEREQIRDARRVPLKVAGYSISLRGKPTTHGRSQHHVHVELRRSTYRDLKAYFLDLATHRSEENLMRELWNLPFEPYAPVRRQLLNIVRAVNRERKTAGFSRIPFDSIRFKRRIRKPFGEQSAA